MIDEPTGEETAPAPDAVHPEETGLFSASAVIKIAVGDRAYLTAGEGNGPVNAIDEALRRALLRFYPELEAVRLTDYRVRVLDSRATASAVRVAIESTDGRTVWRTVGVSSDIINASWQALRDSVEFALENGGKDNISFILMTDETGPVCPEEGEEETAGAPAEENFEEAEA